LPVRSAVLKQDTGGLVVRWVTTGESPLLYVFSPLPFFSSPCLFHSVFMAPTHVLETNRCLH
ncbi:hypothetical protein BKA66DRAFT_427261, partial [Pyrenochaeta sp. MPI-SDFR-AT-0127]